MLNDRLCVLGLWYIKEESSWEMRVHLRGVRCWLVEHKADWTIWRDGGYEDSQKARDGEACPYLVVWCEGGVQLGDVSSLERCKMLTRLTPLLILISLNQLVVLHELQIMASDNCLTNRLFYFNINCAHRPKHLHQKRGLADI